MNASVQKGINALCADFGSQIVQILANEFGFDVADAMTRLSLDKMVVATKKTTKASATKEPKSKTVKGFPLPFVGTINQDACHAIEYNGGLMTQCVKSCATDQRYCEKCLKEASQSANGKPKFGDIEDRLKCGLTEFRDAKGRLVANYPVFLEKKGLTMEQALEEAKKNGIEIPAELLEKKEVKRGRPAKNTDASSVSSDEVKEPKKRGRKPAEKPVVSGGDDLLAELAKQIDEAEEEVPAPEPAVEETASVAESQTTTESKRRGRKPMSDAEKLAKLEAKKAEKEAEKARKLAEREEAKKAKEVEKEAEKARKLAEREEAKKAKKAEKEAEKARKLAEKKAKEDAKKVEEEKAETKSVTFSVDEEEEDDDMTVDSDADGFIEFEENGVSYARDNEDNVYLIPEDAEGEVEFGKDDVVGFWDDATQQIIFVDNE